MSKDNNKDTLLIKVGLKIRCLRQQRGISQEILAHEADLDRSYMGGVERGERNISLKNLGKISTALNIPLREIMEDI